MSRCKACDAVLTDGELAMTNNKTGEPEDLCFQCLGQAMDCVVEEEEDTDFTLADLDELIRQATCDEDNL